MQQQPTEPHPSSENETADDLLQIAALIAHQLKTPISAAGSLLNAILGEYAGPVTGRQRKMLKRMDECIGESLEAMRRMLEIVRPASEEELSCAVADLSAALQNAEVRFRQALKANSIALTIKAPHESLFARILGPALIEVLNSLLSNALKYTPDNGRIHIAARRSEHDDTVIVTVGDSGIGIPEENRERIFEPFFRTASARSSDRPGVGLGLAFVKSIISRTGGEISAGKSDLGGAEFTVILPVAYQPTEEEDTDGAQFRVVIVGGVAAGPKAAAKIIRLMPDADVTVIEKGHFMSYAGCGLPYYVAGGVRRQRELMCTPAGAVRDPVFFQRIKNVHVSSSTEAVGINRVAKRVHVRSTTSGHEAWVHYDKLLLATGASPIVPPIPGVEHKGVFTLHGVQDAEGIKSALSEGLARDVVIIGGGLVGLEMTEALADCGCRVTIVEREEQILRIVDWEVASLVEKHMESQGVRVMTGTTVLSIDGAGAGGESVNSIRTDKGTFPADMVILAVGVRPNVELARDAGLEVSDETGAISVDEHLQTSDPDIYAAGDCVECRHVLTGRPCYVPLGSTANKQGRVAAVNICGGSETFPGVLGTTICKVFDYHVGRTGLSEAEARELEYDVITVLAPAPDRAHYLPTAKWLYLKTVVERQTGRLLGAQTAGPGDGAKRIDVASMAITTGLTVAEIANADLCYAPPYAPVMDNLITAANIARNKLSGAMVGITPMEVRELCRTNTDFVLLDVRTPQEHEVEKLRDAVCVPLAALRGRLGELPRDKLIVTFCNISLRGYEAALILQAAGFENVRVMDGGLAMWPYAKE